MLIRGSLIVIQSLELLDSERDIRTTETRCRTSTVISCKTMDVWYNGQGL